MADLENLRTASLYINNQLLSRGLLRDGQSIDFTNPESSEGGSTATMGRIISVVNDLILRRDVSFGSPNIATWFVNQVVAKEGEKILTAFCSGIAGCRTPRGPFSSTPNPPRREPAANKRHLPPDEQAGRDASQT